MNIVITGASSGMGKVFAENFEKEGNTVVKIARSFENLDSSCYVCDLGNEEQVKSTAKLIKEKFERIDILINNAGFGIFGASEMLENEKIKSIMNVNFLGSVFLTNDLLSNMTNGGRIFNICSNCALFSLPFRGFYCASKSALASWSLALSGELKSFGIYSTVINPCATKTNFSKNRVISSNSSDKYSDVFNKSLGTLKKRKDNRMSIEVACKRIYRILTKKKPKKYYNIGFITHFSVFLEKIIGKNNMQKILEKTFI